jgi:glutamyl-tRNA synthetase
METFPPSNLQTSRANSVRSRLAPTPSGFLHLGNAFSFALTWLLARYHEGTLLLRIDDIDNERRRPAYVQDVFQTLRWLQLDWDVGPKDVMDFEARFSQLLALNRYAQLLDGLRQAGGVYACNCSRSQVVASSMNGIYPGTCRHRNLALDTPEAAWRVHVPENTVISILEYNGGSRHIQLDTAMGDFVVRRRNGLPAYQIASLADDLHYGINLIVRGVDLLPSTAAQLFLAAQLPPNSFTKAVFYHHPLLKDEGGQKLSKSAGAASLLALRGQLPDPAPVYRALANALGLSADGVAGPHDMLRRFTPTALPGSEGMLTGLW